MQLMPATARRFGVRNVFNVEQNIRAGISYLSWLMKTFNGDLRLVTAAYFVGEGRILERGLDYASPEAFKYVTVVARIYRAKQLDRRIHSNGAPPIFLRSQDDARVSAVRSKLQSYFCLFS
jgi:soluble lytic murein transglycosylase-like protein